MKRLPQILMLSAAILLLGVFFFPLWNITLFAPQYPDGINMYIWVNQITGDTPYTLQNVNILNHYIGMKFIEPDSIPELTYFPYIVFGMAFLGIIAGFTKKRSVYWSWAGILIILGGLGIYDFYTWLYDYGHNLDPNAPIKIPGMVYQPPLIGSKMLLNFDASSWPHIGSLFLGLSTLLAIVAGIFIKKNKTAQMQKTKNSEPRSFSQAAILAIVVMSIISSCSSGPKTIYYGEENCHSCQMTIVDQRYAAQLITDKGKAYNFDAIECMLHFKEAENLGPDNLKHQLVATFDQPGVLSEVSDVTFVYTMSLPSPMGLNVTAFSNLDNMPTVGKDLKIFKWNDMEGNFNDFSNKLESNK